jgi:hypothetical protein
MSEPRALPDQAARELIERELGVNLLVEAGAGFGKTEHLAKRMAAGIAAALLYSGCTCSPPDMPRGLRRGYLSHPDHWTVTFRGGQSSWTRRAGSRCGICCRRLVAHA